ncbi:hypothetical protein ACFP3I_08675 [Chryseobacterium arachidis]|uniref:hypothetical protein n=1 Tax=Chryseobacterium arachidis TaxID=1416778 RepID=UPI00361F8865
MLTYLYFYFVILIGWKLEARSSKFSIIPLQAFSLLFFYLVSKCYNLIHKTITFIV